MMGTILVNRLNLAMAFLFASLMSRVVVAQSANLPLYFSLEVQTNAAKLKCFGGLPGASYAFLCATNFGVWYKKGAITQNVSGVTWTDPNPVSSDQRRFYRAAWSQPVPKPISSIVLAAQSSPSPLNDYSAKSMEASSTNFTILGAALREDTHYPHFWISRAQTGSAGAETAGGTPFGVAFELDGSQFIIDTWGKGQSTIVSVDGWDENTHYTLPSDGSEYNVMINLTAGGHHVVELRNANYFRQIWTPITNGWSGKPFPTLAKLAVLGDSFIEHVPTNTWPDYLKLYGTNVDVWKLGQGGTGWVNSFVGSGRTNFLGRVGDVAATGTKYVLIAGGINDGGFSSNVIFLAAFNTATNLKAACAADTHFVVLGTLWPRTPTDPMAITSSLAISNGCIAAGLITANEFIDTLSDPWFTGHFQVPGSGNAPLYIADGTHPTSLGHAYLAARVAEKLAGIWPELFPK